MFANFALDKNCCDTGPLSSIAAKLRVHVQKPIHSTFQSDQFQLATALLHTDRDNNHADCL